MEPESGTRTLLAQGDIRQITSRRVTFRVPAKFIYAAPGDMHHEDGAGFEMCEIILILQEQWLLLFAPPNETVVPQLSSRA